MIDSAIVALAIVSVIGLAALVLHSLIAPAPLAPVPAPPTPARRRRRRPRRAAARRERAARPPRQTIDRAALVAALRNLGHRADEARRMAAAVPAGVTDIGDAINFLYRRG